MVELASSLSVGKVPAWDQLHQPYKFTKRPYRPRVAWSKKSHHKILPSLGWHKQILKTYPFHNQKKTHLLTFATFIASSSIPWSVVSKSLCSPQRQPYRHHFNVCAEKGASWRTSSDQDIIMNAIVDNKGTLLETSPQFTNEAHSFFWSQEKVKFKKEKKTHGTPHLPRPKPQLRSTKIVLPESRPSRKPQALALAKDADTQRLNIHCSDLLADSDLGNFPRDMCVWLFLFNSWIFE